MNWSLGYTKMQIAHKVLFFCIFSFVFYCIAQWLHFVAICFASSLYFGWLCGTAWTINWKMDDNIGPGIVSITITTLSTLAVWNFAEKYGVYGDVVMSSACSALCQVGRIIVEVAVRKSGKG